jgi:hypothetical protein
VIKKPSGRRGHSPRWAAEPQNIIIIIIIIIIIHNVEKYDRTRHATDGNTAHAFFMIDTVTHYEYITFIAFPLQKLSHVRTSMLLSYAHVNYYNHYALTKKLKPEIVLVFKL